MSLENKWEFFCLEIDQFWPEPFEALLRICGLEKSYLIEEIIARTTKPHQCYAQQIKQYIELLKKDMNACFKGPIDNLVNIIVK